MDQIFQRENNPREEEKGKDLQSEIEITKMLITTTMSKLFLFICIF